jgi:N-acetyl-anhydromuramyl-L-alanine amidase AmpD
MTTGWIICMENNGTAEDYNDVQKESQRFIVRNILRRLGIEKKKPHPQEIVGGHSDLFTKRVA